MDTKQKALILLLHKHGIWIQDTLSVLYGLRPSMRYSVDDTTHDLLKKVLPLLGLEIVTYTYQDIGKPVCMIGKDISTIKKASRADISGDQASLGAYLGYPSCCIKFWEKNKKHRDTMAFLTKQNSKAFDYKLNYLFNFDTRVQAENLYLLTELSEKNYSQHGTYILPYIPCSFDCKASLQYTSALTEILSREFIEYTQHLTSYLKNTFLVIDTYRFIALSGTLQDDELHYTKVIFSDTCFDSTFAKKIAEGNMIQWEKEKLTVCKNSEVLGILDVRSEIIQFA